MFRAAAEERVALRAGHVDHDVGASADCAARSGASMPPLRRWRGSRQAGRSSRLVAGVREAASARALGVDRRARPRAKDLRWPSMPVGGSCVIVGAAPEDVGRCRSARLGQLRQRRLGGATAGPWRRRAAVRDPDGSARRAAPSARAWARGCEMTISSTCSRAMHVARRRDGVLAGRDDALRPPPPAARRNIGSACLSVQRATVAERASGMSRMKRVSVSSARRRTTSSNAGVATDWLATTRMQAGSAISG